ncbi:MAG: hypothetical protein K2X94_00970 [Amoebophilaceae bacterium]|nr:hypothetical protein [Amoebophilaceae bacterium]
MKIPNVFCIFVQSGSCFTKISAAWLIEEAGFKGLRTAHVAVYDLHALVLVHLWRGNR